MLSESSLPVEFLFTLTGTLGAASSIQGGPAGTRRIVNVTGGSIDGPRLRGTILPPGGDWITVRADGTAKLDVRLTIETDDGALILMTYTGISAPNASNVSVTTTAGDITIGQQINTFSTASTVMIPATERPSAPERIAVTIDPATIIRALMTLLAPIMRALAFSGAECCRIAKSGTA